MIAYFEALLGQFQNPVTAVAQILGFIPMFLGFFIFRNVKRSTSIYIKALADSISAVHFFLLGQMTGCVINALNMVRGVCFSQKGKAAWASGPWIPVIFCLATIAGSLVGWTGWESLLPMAGSCLAVMGYWSSSTRSLRRFNFAGISLWTVYGVITLSIPTLVGNTISLSSILVTEWKTRNNQSE